MSQRFEVHLGPLPTPSGRPSDPARPFRILVLGDFAGASPGVTRSAPAQRRPAVVDAETLDHLLAGIEPGIEVESDPSSLRFRKMSDFHPDALCAAVPHLRELCDTRQRLTDPVTFEATVGELRQEAPGETPPPEESGADTLERLLGGRLPSPSETSTGGPVDLSGFIHNLIAPHLQPGAPAHQAEVVALFERGMGEALRRVLHAPKFRELEATWRGMQWLMRGLDIDERIQCELLDLNRHELVADLGGQVPTGDTDLFRVLEPRDDPTPWSVIVGLFHFDDSEADCALLQSLGQLAAHLGAPFLAAADPAIFGCSSAIDLPRAAVGSAQAPEVAQRWQALRRSPAAAWVGLSLPRFLLRLPYGAATDVVDPFAFEEQPEGPSHDSYLWGNPALAWARLLGQGFLERDWNFEPGSLRELVDLPSHAYEEGSQWRMQAVAETTIPDSAAQAILDAGVMPLCSRQGTNSALFSRFQSLAVPAARPLGPW